MSGIGATPGVCDKNSVAPNEQVDDETSFAA